ncbi:Hsp70 family protein [Saccharopolyspora rhizosphaerae]|uniref:Hsp70 family protein n=1 Tax=Saccharopolyspora rhizosphaerae TaxID=2492662 RepID=A0A426JYM5_9PSEU|nr:Hsp70 family protein [Saccharopolyspora rhizosphaerae]RRO18307.1 Hsp70 family protein [Saccharopolyspora rhizosphaerae]
MRYGVGIDLGTSFTSAAVSGPGGTRVVSLSPEVVVPSVAHPAPDGALLTGKSALDSVSDPSRVARNFKRRLGDPTPLVLGGSAYSPAALMAAQLRDVLDAVTAEMDGPPESVALTYPAIWGPYRQEHFTEVPRLAGVDDFRLITEPEAAATHYSTARKLEDGEVVAVYDLGGGTFDTTILRMRAGQMEILGTPEGIEHLGGIDFDEALLAHVDERLDGAISRLDPSDPGAASALATIQSMCVRAKEELSTEPDVDLAVPLPSGPRDVTVTRAEFNEMIRPSVQLTTEALHRTTASAGLRVEDLSAVLLAGGSSRVPLVAQMISEEFGKPVRVTLHPKHTVALGAARTATQPRPTPAHESTSDTATHGKSAVAPVPQRTDWLVPVVAAAAALAIGVGVTVFATTGSTPTSPQGAVAEKPAPPDGPLPVYDGKPLPPFAGYLGSDANWGGSAIPEEGTEQGTTIKAVSDPAHQGLRVSWLQDKPAQVYLQTSNPRGTLDLTAYSENRGALVFDAVVHTPPHGGTTKVGMHCEYPCRSEVPASHLFAAMPVEQPATVKIPLSCFVGSGLDIRRVNTPFLVWSQSRMDITFANVRVEAEVPGATPCNALS